jgi:hypothetical protein
LGADAQVRRRAGPITPLARARDRKEKIMIVDLGSVVEETKGTGGFYFDSTGPSPLRL